MTFYVSLREHTMSFILVNMTCNALTNSGVYFEIQKSKGLRKNPLILSTMVEDNLENYNILKVEI